VSKSRKCPNGSAAYRCGTEQFEGSRSVRADVRVKERRSMRDPRRHLARSLREPCAQWPSERTHPRPTLQRLPPTIATSPLTAASRPSVRSSSTLGTAHPLVAVDWVKENKTPDQSGAEYTLWLFCNRALNPCESEMESNRIPPALKNAIARWSGQPSSGSVAMPHITTPSSSTPMAPRTRSPQLSSAYLHSPSRSLQSRPHPQQRTSSNPRPDQTNDERERNPVHSEDSL
jgi:hypothetical protein